MTTSLVRPDHGSVGLPRERLHQLRALADKRGTTLVGVIEGVISQAIEAGEIPDEILGFKAERGDFGRIQITVRDTAFPAVGAAKAEAIALVLDAAAGKVDADARPGFALLPGKLVPIKLDEELNYPATMAIGRHGRAVLISFRDERTSDVMKTALTPSLALDLARMIRRAAGTA